MEPDFDADWTWSPQPAGVGHRGDVHSEWGCGIGFPPQGSNPTEAPLSFADPRAFGGPAPRRRRRVSPRDRQHIGTRGGSEQWTGDPSIPDARAVCRGFLADVPYPPFPTRQMAQVSDLPRARGERSIQSESPVRPVSRGPRIDSRSPRHLSLPAARDLAGVGSGERARISHVLGGGRDAVASTRGRLLSGGFRRKPNR